MRIRAHFGIDWYGTTTIYTRCHFLIVSSDMSVVLSWGWSEHGQLGHGDEENKSIPSVIQAMVGKQIAAITSGNGFSIAIEILDDTK